MWWVILVGRFVYISFTDTYIMTRESVYLYIGLILLSAIYSTYVLDIEHSFKNEIYAGLMSVECLLFLRYGRKYWYVLAVLTVIFVAKGLKTFIGVKLGQRVIVEDGDKKHVAKRRIKYGKVLQKIMNDTYQLVGAISGLGIVLLLLIQVIIPAIGISVKIG